MTTTRRIGVLGATGIGVGSMLGSGVFSDLWEPVLALGDWYLAPVAIAAVVALANAMSTSQLASRHPIAGGVYSYGRLELGHSWGVLAGVAFLVGKTASVAVAALVMGAYLVPAAPQAVATVAVLLAWGLNSRGITRTAGAATSIASIVTVVLVVLCAAAYSEASAGFGWFASADGVASTSPGAVPAVLAGASAVFFAFAGYGRVATLGEEVRTPERTIPRAVLAALAVVVVVYAMVAAALRPFFGPMHGQGGQAASPQMPDAPLEALASLVGMPSWPLAAAAALSAGGAMLAVMAGAGRTAMAMAREGDLPRTLAHQGRSGAPWRAEAVVAVVAVALVWTVGVSLLLVSVASILVYYGVANVAAIRQRRAGRTASLRAPVWLSGLGLVGCLVLGGAALAGVIGA
ncbi:APC family permease [Demequina sp.]|uniref:APC family permease n=1 Tax=Demequina sp. TaxID=2050685 RepID=UPI003A87A7B5